MILSKGLDWISFAEDTKATKKVIDDDTLEVIVATTLRKSDVNKDGFITYIEYQVRLIEQPVESVKLNGVTYKI